MKTNHKTFSVLLALVLSALPASASMGTSPADLVFPPLTSGGHDFNHSPIGQTFTAPAADVTAGIYLSDSISFTNWLATVYPGQIVPGAYPYTVSPAVAVRIELRAGEGAGGPLLYTEDRTLTAPFSGFVDIDAGAAGVQLSVGSSYTLMLTDISGQIYPQGVTGWVVPAFTSYDGGSSILQGNLGSNATDSYTGDNCFHVVDNIVSGSDAVITAYAPRVPGFIVINGGVELNDHLWTTGLNASNTTFLDGLINWYQTGLLVDYTGIRTSQGILLTSLTVRKATTPLSLAGAALASGTRDVPYSSPLSISVSGGLGPFVVTVEGLPAGLSFDGASVSGIPTAAGSFAPLITVTDARGTTATTRTTLTIAQPAAPPAVSYTIRDEAKGKITVVGDGFLMVGSRKLIWNAATVIKVNTSSGQSSTINTSVKPGQIVQWKGLLNKASNTVLTSKMEIN